MTFKEHLYSFMNRAEADELLASFNNAPKSSFKLNLLKVKQINDLYENRSYKPLKHVNNAFYFNKETDKLGKSIYFYGGAYYIQEASAMIVESLLNIKENDKVLDMCAAPGGKSFNALLSLNNTGLLVCNDIHNIRSRVLSSNIEKYGFKNAIVLNDNSNKYKSKFENYFDKIILDAPCSGSGMFRKDELAVKDWSIEKVYECKKIQLSLLEDAYYMLKEQGRVIYSTCSYSIQENEEVIEEFIKLHPDMKIINIELNKLYNDTINLSGGLRLYPSKYDGEGQVMFLLEKDSKTTTINNKKKKKQNRTVIEKEVIEFLNQINYRFDKEKIIKIKDNYYYADFDYIDLSGIHTLRYGLHLGMVEKSRFIPSHSLAMVFDSNKQIYLELDKKQAIDYLHGYDINDYKDSGKGFKIVSYKNLPLGFVKQVNTTLKNHLPKGIRVTDSMIEE